MRFSCHPFSLRSAQWGHGLSLYRFLVIRLFRDVVVSLLTRLETSPHDYRFCHIIDDSTFDNVFGYDLFYSSNGVDWTPCNSGRRRFYYTFDSGPFHDLPITAVEAWKMEAKGNIFIGYGVPYCLGF